MYKFLGKKYILVLWKIKEGMVFFVKVCIFDNFGICLGIIWILYKSIDCVIVVKVLLKDDFLLVKLIILIWYLMNI